MGSQRVFALILSILLTTTSLSSTPLLKADSLSPSQQAETGVNQQTLANYVIGVSANRIPLKLIPIPSVSVTQGAKIGPNEADIVVLALPATRKGGNVDLIGFITGFLTKAAARQEGLSGQLIADLYTSLYDQVIRMGAKQAFLPYENLTFTFIIIVWIKTMSLSEFISNVGASMLKSVSDSLILVAFSLTKSVVQDIKSMISGKIEEIARDLQALINDELIEDNYKLINYLNSKIDSLKCNKVCRYIDQNQTIQVCSYTLSPITVSLSVTTTFKNGDMKTIILIDETSSVYQSGNLAIISKEIFLQNARNIVGSQPYDKDLVDSSKVNSVIDVIGGFIYDKIFKLEHTSPSSSSQFTISAGGEYSSCEAAKIAMKEAANAEVTKITTFLRDAVNRGIESAVKKIKEVVDETFNIISDTLEKARNNLIDAADEAVKSTKDYLETTVHTAVSQVITKLNPTAFAVYSLAEGLSQALQTCISSVSIAASPQQIDDLDQSILVIEEKQDGTREIRLPGSNDIITAEKSTSLGEKALSAAKGFAAGLLGAIFGPAARKMINVIPSIFVVNIQLKSNNRWLVAPSWPGIHTINLKVAPHTYAEWLSSLPKKLMNSFFKDTKKNDLVVRLEQLFNINLDKMPVEGIETGVEMPLPYLVLPPYFIVEKVKVENGIVNLKFVAVYDFSALMRIFISEQINKFKESINKVTEIIDKLRETIKSVIKGVVEKLADTVISYFLSKFSISFIRNLIESLYERLIEYIFDKFINPILDQLFDRYIKVYIDKVIEFVNEILNRVEQQLELFDKYLALTLSVIRVDVVNCDIELTPAIPSLGFVCGRSIDQFGKVEVQLSQSIFYRFLGSCIGTIPLYRSVGRDGRVSHFIAPWATFSLEPVVIPLIPVVRVVNNKLNAVFLSPFINQVTNVRYTFVVDGIEAQMVSVDTIRKSAIVGVRVLSVQIDDTRGIGAILPLPIESPIVLNPSILASRV